jgi:hypothetical protein
LWVWHSDVTGRNPHVHVFMHCPPRQRHELNTAFEDHLAAKAEARAAALLILRKNSVAARSAREAA